MALKPAASRRSVAVAAVGFAILSCSPPRDADRLQERLLDVVDRARVEVEPAASAIAGLEVVAGEDGPRVHAPFDRDDGWVLQSSDSIFGERAAELAIWSFAAALPTRDPASVRLESRRRALEAWDPARKPRPFAWFHSSGGFFPRGFHLALPRGTTPAELDLVAGFAPSAGLALELAAPGAPPPVGSDLVRWASLAGDVRRSLFVPGGGEIRFELEVPEAARLKLAAGRRAHPWADPTVPSHLAIEVLESGRWRALAMLEFPGTSGAPPAWQPIEVSLPASGRGDRLELRIRVPDASSRGTLAHFVADPVIVTGGRRDHRPDLIVIVVDGLRADHVGAREGAPSLTPHLDRMAGRGLRFTSVSAASTWTRPSVASMFTGRLPSAHGVEGEDEASRLPRAVITLAEILRVRGWATVALSANPHLDPAFGVSRGFARVASRVVDGGALESSLGAAIDDPDHSPQFLFGFFMDTHWPWTDREDDRDAEAIDAPRVDPQRLGRADGREERPSRAPSGAEIGKLRALYRENVRYVDARIGALLERLRGAGLDRDTIVVVTADHGEAFGERGAFFHGWNVHRELEHVPLIVAGPGVPRGVRDEPLSLVHLPALLLELLGVPDAALSDRPLAHRILEGGAAPPPVIETKFRGSDQAALVDGRWKLVLGRRRGAVRLYDLVSDPREQEDRSAAEPQRLARMRAELERRLAEAEAARATSDEPAEGDVEELGEQLRALGYL